MFGHQFLLPIPDLDHTAFLLILGANPLASNGSMMTAPGMRERLKALRARGGRVVVVDPRRTETARVADSHLAIRPGTDVLLLLALLATIFEEGLERPGRLAAVTNGLATLRELVQPFPAARVAAAVGLEADAIRELGRAFATAPTAVCYGRLGVSVQRFGGLCQWLINALNVVTGRLDEEGGARFSRPAIDVLALTGRGRIGRWKSRVRGLPEFGGELPSATLAEEIETPGAGQVRALITIAGNPVLSAPSGTRLERVLPNLELMVSIDPALNETTRHAHFVLPTTPPLQRDHYDIIFNALAVADTARYSPPLFPPDPGLRHDWQVLAGLSRRLDRGPWAARLRRRMTAALGPRRQLDLALRTGPHGAGVLGLGRGLTLKRLESHPHGVDLGPRRTSLPERLPTGRIELAPAIYIADLPRAESLLAQDRPSSESLRLVGRRHVQSNNSWMHNVERLMRGRDRCTLLMHPEDAETRDLTDGQRVEVHSRVGRIEVALEISDEMRPGVVSLPHGWGHDRPGTRQTIAARHPGASINDLTDDLLVDPLCGNAAFSDVEVEVRPL
jgi:anaerobic selenocysteine-containing dehydrogenase